MVSVTSGIWKLVVYPVEGGCEVHVWSGDVFGWVVHTHTEGPPKHVFRNLTRRMHKELKKCKISSTSFRT